ncbi:MAG: 23S rRNA (uracil(1939)-C(5))-methyltransferase RlmD [Cellvibrionaceae bacterium]
MIAVIDTFLLAYSIRDNKSGRDDPFNPIMARFYKPKKKREHKNVPRSQKTINNVVIERLSDDGRGITQVNGKTTFVDGALVDECVNISIRSETARFSEAVITEIVSSSPSRILPLCKHYATCGGCNLQHMTLEEQRLLKQSTLENKLKHWAEIKHFSILPAITSDGFAYRQRVRFGVQKKSNKRMFGFRQKNSKALIDITECPIMVTEFSPVLTLIRSWLDQYSPDIGHIELISSVDKIGVVIRHTQPILTNIRQSLQEKLFPLKGVCWFQSSKGGTLESADGQTSDPRLQYVLPDYDLSLVYHPQDFIQSNVKVNRNMINQAISLLKPKADETIVDLFCGIGNFSLPLSRLAKHVVGVEGVNAMVERASENARINNCHNTQFIQADLSHRDCLNVDFGDIDGLILDPPRSGAKEICENINKLMPKRVVYVSCDSSTFARDAQLLCKNGYQLQQVGIMDMFPQTSHSEVMGLFTHSSWS